MWLLILIIYISISILEIYKYIKLKQIRYVCVYMAIMGVALVIGLCISLNIDIISPATIIKRFIFY